MTQIRLLPVVIVAACALLLLKGLGIVTNGGYVLVGVEVARAAGAAAVQESTTNLEMPAEPTMSDKRPLLDDSAPTLQLGSDTSHSTDGEEDPFAAGSDGIGQLFVLDPDCPPAGATSLTEGATDASAGHGATAEQAPAALDASQLANKEACEEAASAVAGGTDTLQGSEALVIERLDERREVLDALSDELDMRMALVEAAEKRLEERTAALQALEARIEAMVDEKRTLEESQFTAVVAMYETMRPKDAAAIFDELEMDVLIRVARAVNPRKMAPIMARMNPVKAKELTAGLAVDQVEPTIDLSAENLAALPQIVGQ